MILAQKSLAATTQEIVWNGDFPCTITSMSVANLTGGALSVRVWLVKADQVLGDQHALVYDYVIAPGDQLPIEDDFDLVLSDKVWARASALGLSMTILGVQI